MTTAKVCTDCEACDPRFRHRHLLSLEWSNQRRNAPPRASPPRRHHHRLLDHTQHHPAHTALGMGHHQHAHSGGHRHDRRIHPIQVAGAPRRYPRPAVLAPPRIRHNRRYGRKMTAQSPRRRWNTVPWPWPGDSREDKAKRVALSYRDLLTQVSENSCDDPAGELRRLDQHWAALGVYWPVPSVQPVEPDDWLTAAEIAHYTDRAPADIYRWARRGAIEQRTGPDGTPQYLLGSALKYQRQQRERRTGN